ncbi:unnamed protein product [Rotaria sp. Silwood1]|nr:unnamed protein product [Rotaria sp. Silwood1]CAF3390449.1 unnamed protein product [Rotaria sp. Silwood1]CAF4732080.1 unnamed protein product [Rotaria sp. Silwood1]CAF4939823.1 unnamed protein product [Rotaria sp. Silwood1]
MIKEVEEVPCENTNDRPEISRLILTGVWRHRLRSEQQNLHDMQELTLDDRDMSTSGQNDLQQGHSTPVFRVMVSPLQALPPG